jgi:carbamoyl-phosphate synthase small subunit
LTAKIALEDGSVYTGTAIGMPGEVGAEVVFNTAMSGYQEIFTDPSYHGQIVLMTQPHIGNCGVTSEDEESDRTYLSGLVVRELARRPSNFRAQEPIDAYLKRMKVVGISNVDTRAITKLLRVEGSLQGVISSTDLDDASLVKKARTVPSTVGRDLVAPVTTHTIQRWTQGFHTPWAYSTFRERADGLRIVAMDFGVKYNILRILAGIGFEVWRVPAHATAAEIMALKPHGLFLSNGPGDPAAVSYAIATIRELYTQLPTFGICLGHQLLGLAMGYRTEKLKFGHHGANHPVMDLRSGKVQISSQNHCFVVTRETLGADVVETFRNLNDQSNEGVRHRTLPVFSVQFHPEASPGPNDCAYLFDDFVRMVRTRKPLEVN